MLNKGTFVFVVERGRSWRGQGEFWEGLHLEEVTRFVFIFRGFTG